MAVVGGGVAGLSAALHLAPLVSQGLIQSPIDVYEATPARKGRSIGVGIWSTALDPFRTSDRPSHQAVWDRMTNSGSWVGKVGYRTPSGNWLVNSKLPTTYPVVTENAAEESTAHMPGLLFIRECDVEAALHTAVAAEEHNSTIRVHCNAPVESIMEDSSFAWSAPLVLETGQTTERDYHFIIAADGTNSQLRNTYAGHSPGERQRLTGTSALPSAASTDPTSDSNERESSWAEMNHQQVTFLEDRNYTVFRGNAPFDEPGSEGLNFQTWGEGGSMRFATVHMSYPSKEKRTTREEKQVWFITIDDADIVGENDPVKRKEMLLKAFEHWHSPICDIESSTPAEEILAERAIAHRFAVRPITEMNTILERIRGKRPPSSGKGPALIFIGDAFMCIDPILAQGFSVGMEAAAALPKQIHKCLGMSYDDLMFDPYELRSLLERRHDERLERLTCLLRATEIVQALGQPRDGTVTGFLAKHVIRPTMRFAPSFIKTRIFDATLRYSLGLPLSGKKKEVAKG